MLVDTRIILAELQLLRDLSRVLPLHIEEARPRRRHQPDEYGSSLRLPHHHRFQETQNKSMAADQNSPITKPPLEKLARVSLSLSLSQNE